MSEDSIKLPVSVLICRVVRAEHHCKDWNSIALVCDDRAFIFETSDGVQNAAQALMKGRNTVALKASAMHIEFLGEQIDEYKVCTVEYDEENKECGRVLHKGGWLGFYLGPIPESV